MRMVDRVIFVLIALFLLVLAVALAANAFGWQGPLSLVGAVEQLAGNPLGTVIVSVLSLLAGLHLLFYGIQQEAEEGIRQETEIGHVRISLRAIENLIYRAAQTVRGIKDVETTVHPSPEGIAVSLTLVVNPDVPIPQLSDEVGRRVRSQVRETVGVTVGDVAIEIRNIAVEPKARVE